MSSICLKAAEACSLSNAVVANQVESLYIWLKEQVRLRCTRSEDPFLYLYIRNPEISPKVLALVKNRMRQEGYRMHRVEPHADIPRYFIWWGSWHGYYAYRLKIGWGRFLNSL